MAEETNKKGLENEKINNDDLEDVSGGYIFHVGKEDTPDPEHRWEVIDDKTGKVLGRYSTRKQARAEADYKGASKSRIWRGNYLKKLRDAYKQHAKYENEKPLDTDWEPPF